MYGVRLPLVRPVGVWEKERDLGLPSEKPIGEETHRRVSELHQFVPIQTQIRHNSLRGMVAWIDLDELCSCLVVAYS